MNSFRCIGLLLVVLLSACDAQNAPAPKPKVAAEVKAAAQADSASAKPAVVPPAPVTGSVHESVPNVPVVPVMIAREPPSPLKKPVVVKAQASKAAPGDARHESTSDKSRAPVASKSKPAGEVVEQTSLAKPTLDLSLPTNMVKEIEPVGTVAPITPKALLPPLLGEKKTAPKTPFQLNGRLLNNEMQLQLRNEGRQQIDGAALDFEFKQ